MGSGDVHDTIYELPRPVRRLGIQGKVSEEYMRKPSMTKLDSLTVTLNESTAQRAKSVESASVCLGSLIEKIRPHLDGLDRGDGLRYPILQEVLKAEFLPSNLLRGT